MTREDQLRIINQMVSNATMTMEDGIYSGRVPVEWDGIELRQWFADIVTRGFPVPMSRSRRREYRNTVLVNNL